MVGGAALGGRPVSPDRSRLHGQGGAQPAHDDAAPHPGPARPPPPEHPPTTAKSAAPPPPRHASATSPCAAAPRLRSSSLRGKSCSRRRRCRSWPRAASARSPSRLPTATSVRRDSRPPRQPLPWPASDPLPDMPSSHRAEASAGGLLADGGLCQPAPCAKQLPLPRRPCDGRAASPTHRPVPTRSDAHDWHDQAPSGPSSPPT